MSLPGAPTDAAGGEDEDDRDDGERGEERRLPGALQRPQCVSLSAGEKKKTHTLNPSLTVRVLAAHSQMDFLSFSFFLDDIFFDTVRHL